MLWPAGLDLKAAEAATGEPAECLEKPPQPCSTDLKIALHTCLAGDILLVLFSLSVDVWLSRLAESPVAGKRSGGAQSATLPLILRSPSPSSRCSLAHSRDRCCRAWRRQAFTKEPCRRWRHEHGRRVRGRQPQRDRRQPPSLRDPRRLSCTAAERSVSLWRLPLVATCVYMLDSLEHALTACACCCVVRAAAVEQAAWAQPTTVNAAPLHSSALRAQTQGQQRACSTSMRFMH